MSAEERKGRWQLLHDPLLHFFVIALAAFSVRQAITPAEGKIVIDQALVDGLRRIGGVGSGAEQSDAVLVDAWLRDELLFREALALGLERGDEIVRRRLILKMETILSAIDREPSEDELASFLAANSSDFVAEANISLNHVFFSRDRRDDAHADALMAQQLESPRGDSFMLGDREIRRTEEQLDQRFGGQFGQDVAALEGDSWLGPVESRYGWHLVRITERNESSAPSLDSVHGLVEAAWREEQRDARLRSAGDTLRQRTRIERRVDLTP
jgi:peptidyl-prolyl cis-trans isomerase C